ncbi:MAG: FAD-dependent monooxygenase [Proteobacteria bacterium]|nr:FAD-dependent monooxygenase [Pseudomonadota bacterium]
MTGYSGTPLPRKLGIKPGVRLLRVNAPEGLDDWLAPLPEGVVACAPREEGKADVILYFTKEATQLAARFGDHLGALKVVGPRFSYPLALMHAERYIGHRLALIGDAAHAIHPIAGQGLNLGLRDVAALAEVLVDARRLGLDIGHGSVLERYQRWRRFDNVVLAAATDGLNRLFSNDVLPIRIARDLGLAAVNRIAPAKRFFMRHAMGVLGELPRLVRGEPL